MPEAEGRKHAAIEHCDHACPFACGVALRLAPLRIHVTVGRAALLAPLFGLTRPLLLAQTQCRLRMVHCRFCSASVRAGDPSLSYADREKGLTEHESYCGARTAACALCGQAVLLKENDVHFLLFHPGAPVLDPSSELPPCPARRALTTPWLAMAAVGWAQVTRQTARMLDGPAHRAPSPTRGSARRAKCAVGGGPLLPRQARSLLLLAFRLVLQSAAPCNAGTPPALACRVLQVLLQRLVSALAALASSQQRLQTKTSSCRVSLDATLTSSAWVAVSVVVRTPTVQRLVLRKSL